MSRLMQYRSNKYRHSLSSGFVLSSLARSVQISLLGLGLAHCAAHAATIEVTSHLDDDDAGCTLREAIDTIKDADVGLSGCDNSSSDDFGTNDSVTFSNSLATNNTITLNNKPLTFSPFIPGGDPNNFVLTIDATNIAGGITVDANKRSQVLRVFYATLSIKNVTITGGSSSGVGGGLQTSRSIIGLDNATVSGNSASESGGGISATYNSQITAIDSTFSNNSADTDGGGISIDNISSITLTDSIVSDNSVDGDGGGISVKDISSVMLVNSTVSGNSAADDGGGISIIDSTSFLGMNGTTISGNSAAFDGGGAFIFGSFFEATVTPQMTMPGLFWLLQIPLDVLITSPFLTTLHELEVAVYQCLTALLCHLATVLSPIRLEGLIVRVVLTLPSSSTVPPLLKTAVVPRFVLATLN